MGIVVIEKYTFMTVSPNWILSDSLRSPIPQLVFYLYEQNPLSYQQMTQSLSVESLESQTSQTIWQR